MLEGNNIKKYKWDIAISLCKQDVEFAQKLIKAINPTLEVFFYEHRQEELIGKSGPEEFAKIFKEHSRVIVILSRDEWSKSFYTEIERNAIIDRTSVKNEGYQFLMVIPMMQGEIPPWYPSTRIYASPFRFSIEELARFIEFKVTEEGGVVKELTVEDRYQNFIDRVEAKKVIINLQHQEIAIQSAKDEVAKFMETFNSKIDFLSKTIVDRVSGEPFYPTLLNSCYSYGDYLLTCKFFLDFHFWSSLKTTQEAVVEFELLKAINKGGDGKPIENEQRIFYYTSELQGWGSPCVYIEPSNSEKPVLFHTKDNSQFYDLINIISTDFLIDRWFQLLLSKSIENIERHI